MRNYSLLLWLLFSPLVSLWAQNDALLLSGPMVGYTEMREALLWVQTNGPAEVSFAYAEAADSSRIYRTSTFLTQASEGYTARIIADQVQPGKTYNYTLFLNGQAVDRPYPTRFKTPPLWQFRTDPPEMRLALGSCAFINDPVYDRPGRAYGGEYDIFSSVTETQPDLMLWLGDNLYYREPDWYTATGILHRNTHTRNVAQMQALLAASANYAIWDDHDYGPNNSDYTFRDKELTLDAFKLFWGNPTYGLPGMGGITSSFEWGDAHFFLIDNRYFRDPNDKPGTRTILGEKQRQWLLDALISSSATFKFVCIGGQVINSAAEYENYANIAPEERELILNTIAQAGIKNVIFLTGDRHHSELSKFEKFGTTIYDFTVSPLTSGSHNAEDEANTLRVKGSHVGIRNFGLIDISGERLSRKLKLQLFDTEGKPLWDYEIEAAYEKR